MQQEIPVFPTAVTRYAQSDYISSAQRMEDRFRNQLQPWESYNEFSQPEINEDFVTYVIEFVKLPLSDMLPRAKARSYIANHTKTQSNGMKVRGNWKDFQDLCQKAAEGNLSVDLMPLSQANQKFKADQERVFSVIQDVQRQQHQEKQAS